MLTYYSLLNGKHIFIAPLLKTRFSVPAKRDETATQNSCYDKLYALLDTKHSDCPSKARAAVTRVASAVFRPL